MLIQNVRGTKVGKFRPVTPAQYNKDITLQVLAVHNPSKLTINDEFVPRTSMEKHILKLYERSKENGKQ